MEYRQNDWLNYWVWVHAVPEKGWQCGYEGNKAGAGLCHCAWRELF